MQRQGHVNMYQLSEVQQRSLPKKLPMGGFRTQASAEELRHVIAKMEGDTRKRKSEPLMVDESSESNEGRRSSRRSLRVTAKMRESLELQEELSRRVTKSATCNPAKRPARQSANGGSDSSDIANYSPISSSTDSEDDSSSGMSTSSSSTFTEVSESGTLDPRTTKARSTPPRTSTPTGRVRQISERQHQGLLRVQPGVGLAGSAPHERLRTLSERSNTSSPPPAQLPFVAHRLNGCGPRIRPPVTMRPSGAPNIAVATMFRSVPNIVAGPRHQAPSPATLQASHEGTSSNYGTAERAACSSAGSAYLPILTDPHTWTCYKLSEWINATGNVQLAEKLLSEEVDGEAFMMLSLDDCINHLNLKIGPAAKAQALIQGMNKREQRILKKIRKRQAELELLMSSAPSTNDVTERKRKHEDEAGDDALQVGCATAATTSEQEKERANNDKVHEKLARLLKSELSKAREENSADRRIVLRLDRLNGRRLGNKELANMIHYELVGHNVPRQKWYYVANGKGFSHVVVARFNCRKYHLRDKDHMFINEFFNRSWVQLDDNVGNRAAFWNSITTIPLSHHAMLRQKMKTGGDPLASLRGDDVKLSLLVILEQMIEAEFPFPGGSEGLKIKPTKTAYRKVSRESPIFVVDCEMCITIASRFELTRISLMNEKGELLLDTLVKPHNEIRDYLTEHSGITKELLEGVTIRLADVQKAIRAILPDDAILCGHSIENDLRALQMSHPYCIDLSLLYNFSGRTRARTSLKSLTYIFLGEEIQGTATGHCPVEDCRATLKLLHLKLEKGFAFGNVIYGWNYKEWAAENGVSELGTRFEGVESKRAKITVAQESANGSSIAETAAAVTEQAIVQSQVIATTPVANHDAPASLGPTESDSPSTSKAVFTSKLCVRCGKETSTRCIVRNCDCVSLSPGICVRCMAHTDEKPPAANSATKETYFDFDAVVNVDHIGKTSALTNNMKGSKKTVLFACEAPDCVIQPTETCLVEDTSRFENLSQMHTQLSGRLMEHQVCIVERTVGAETSNKDLDEAVRSLASGTARNGLFVLILASATQSILFIRIKW
ncbi:exonuclease [Aphelenchoides avenae]|nr:exonuclease [Aphelenchus avenae]